MDNFKEFGKSVSKWNGNSTACQLTCLWSQVLDTDHDNDFETEYFPGGLDPFGNKETTGMYLARGVERAVI